MKKLMVAVSLLSLSLMSACSTKTQEPSAISMFNSAVTKLNQTENYVVDKKINIEIKTTNEDKSVMSINKCTKAKMAPQPIYEVDSQTSTTMGDETQAFDMKQYLTYKDERYTLYNQTSDKWDKSYIKKEDIAPFTQKPCWQTIKEDTSQEVVHLEGKDKVEDINENQVSCYVVKVEPKQADIETIIAQLDELESLGVDRNTLSSQLNEEMEDNPIELYFYIDKEEGTLVGERCDLSDMMRDIIIESEGIDEEDVDQFSFTLDVTYGTALDVETMMIPDEVK